MSGPNVEALMPAETKPQTTEAAADPTPDQVGYCHDETCPQFGVEVSLWKNLADVPVMCGCGHLLSPHRVEDKADAGA